MKENNNLFLLLIVIVLLVAFALMYLQQRQIDSIRYEVEKTNEQNAIINSNIAIVNSNMANLTRKVENNTAVINAERNRLLTLELFVLQRI